MYWVGKVEGIPPEELDKQLGEKNLFAKIFTGYELLWAEASGPLSTRRSDFSISVLARKLTPGTKENYYYWSISGNAFDQAILDEARHNPSVLTGCAYTTFMHLNELPALLVGAGTSNLKEIIDAEMRSAHPVVLGAKSLIDAIDYLINDMW